MTQVTIFHTKTKSLVNNLIRPLGLRIVNRSWGPRGFIEAFRRIKGKGVLVNQIIDIGAARGEWTQQCMRVFPDAKNFLIDPLEENQIYLTRLQTRKKNISYWI